MQSDLGGARQVNGELHGEVKRELHGAVKRELLGAVNRELLGRAFGPLEHAFGAVWSVGEIALAIARPHEVVRDPHRDAVLRDIEERGFHVPLSDDDVDLRLSRRGTIHGPNPYVRIGAGPDDRVIAKLVEAKDGADHAVVVCHCYGVPVPRAMARLFGLERLRGTDVVYNVMNHHQRGTFLVWPGSGFATARVSRLLENLRSSVTGARTLVRWLVRQRRYRSVSVVGFSIGGQLALHLLASEPFDGALLYCPVASLHATARELGVMRFLWSPVERARQVLSMAAMRDLEVADPLRHELKCDPSRVHVVVQRHDALAPVRQVEPIRARHPGVRWHELGGTHIWPSGLREIHRIAGAALSPA